MPTTPIDGWEAGVLQDVTPDLARQWIRVSHQRALDLLKPRRMIEDLEMGRWDPLNHQTRPVIVNSSGQLVDGHHRIQMVLMLDEPVPMYVLYVK